MTGVLKGLTGLPHVLGGWIFTTKGEILGSVLPSTYNEESLKVAGELCVKSFQAVASTGQKTPHIEWIFDGHRFFARHLKNGILCVLAEKAVSMQTLLEWMEKESSRLEEAVDNFKPSAPESTSTVGKEFFTALALNLAKIIGPMATFIIEEKSRELGLHQQQAGQAEAIKLVNLLCREIDDANLSYEFSRNMFKYLQK